MTDEQAVQKGRQAEREYAETAQAFETVRQAILAELVATSPANAEKVLKLHMAVQNLTAVQKALMNVVQSGQIAQHALSQAGLTRL